MNLILKINTLKGKINNWLRDNREYKQFKKDYRKILNKISSDLNKAALKGYDSIEITFEDEYKKIAEDWFIVQHEYMLIERPYYILKDKYSRYLRKLFNVIVYGLDAKEPKIVFSW